MGVLALAVEVCRLRADSPESARGSDAAAALGAHPALLKYCLSCAEPNLALLRRLVELSSGSTNRSVEAGLEIFNACSERKLTMAEALAGASATLERERAADERSSRSD
jgi:hypothetical protein